MNHTFCCDCGALRGELHASAVINRGICYCKDCQAFAFALGKEATVLDAQGGTDILQTMPSRIRLTAGQAHLGCLRLTSEGMLRWYATCCDSPLGNTPISPTIAVVGLIHTVFRGVDLDGMAPSRMRVFTASARGDPKPGQNLPFSAALKLGRMVLTAHLRGVTRKTPFFKESGEPAVIPRVLGVEERSKIRERVG